jgi:hypothetical protein
MKTLTAIICILLLAAQAFSQDLHRNSPKPQRLESVVKNTGANTELPAYQYLKQPGHYTTEDWHALVDSFWGPGVPTATKLALFDDFWNTVDQYWGGFPNLYVNWDSLRSVYRPLIEAGVSRGRFAGILSRLNRALQEVHAGVIDEGIDSTLGFYTSYYNLDEYPNYPSFYYRPGIPIIMTNWLSQTNFGAGLTPLPNGNILVYNVMPNHPLGLQPGDLILGYDGIPWMQQFNDLLRAELPMLSACGTILGASTATVNHNGMISAGMNWGLFDTIDVVKYPADDTVHYPTSLLAAITPPYHIATEQLPVKGVSFPDVQGNKLVSWGIVEGTNIGYIYAWDWSGTPGASTKVLFGQAVDELMHVNKVSGLILDFRKNAGGNPGYANDGFKHLFNSDPTYHYSCAIRVKGNDHYTFTTIPAGAFEGRFTPTQEVFDHPIAVLLGPNCVSAGDYNAFRLRFHPMTRSFGKPTNGAYTYCSDDFAKNLNLSLRYSDPYAWRIDDGSVYSNVNNEGYMIHKSFPVDEEVWLTRDGAAKGEDDVVIKALEWIRNLSHAHDVAVEPVYAKPGDAEITLTAEVENPNSHVLSVYAKITDKDKVSVDSIPLYDDGGHGDGDPGDGTWGVKWSLPSYELVYAVDITTEDTAAGSLRTLPRAVQFTTSGPVVFSGMTWFGVDSIPNSGDDFYFKVSLSNNGLTAPIVNVKAALTSLDALASIPEIYNNRKFADIAPGGSVTSISPYKIEISEAFPANKEIPVKVDIMSDDYLFWSDTFSILVREPAGIEDISEPMTRIYPNPTNNVLNIEISNTGQQGLEIEILTITGEILYQKEYKNVTAQFAEQIDFSGYARGIYLVKVKQDSGVYVGKVIMR